jgi:hypothetical protein
MIKKKHATEIGTYYCPYSELKLKYHGNRWKQMITDGNRVAAMVTT